GIVSGGRTESGILSGNQLKKIESEIADVKSQKDSLLSELYSIRDQESKIRAEKAQLELKAKTFELEMRMSEEKKKESEHLVKRKEQLELEIQAIHSFIKSKTSDKDALEKSILDQDKQIVKLQQLLKDTEEKLQSSAVETTRELVELNSSISSLRATIEGKKKELELHLKEIKEKTDHLHEVKKEHSDAKHAIEEATKALIDEKKDLVEIEEKIASTSKSIEKLFEQLKAHEQTFGELGKKMGHVRLEIDRINKEINQITIKKATTSTHLEDLKAEILNYKEFEFLELKKEELSKMISESERILSGLGNVNLAAIDMYDKKKVEIDEVQEKIDRLNIEREAIQAMIREIDERKKESFFETFQAVSDNFSKMFKYIEVGEGHLYLDKPSEPFESGLFIKLRRNNKEYALDALSGGEKTLVAMMFIFALQFFKPAPFYILDEVDAALDKHNSKNLADLVNQMAKDSQFILVSHNDTVMSNADSVIGVAKTGGISKLVGVKLTQVASV
ncbi:AAA family ATPase, partial [Candidatus Micrarchaeota archaeon]|nr:AAA family ATPase [Candidatus Micrarchaeota archaeon]